MDMGDFFMRKISISSSKGLLLNYIIRIIITSIISIFAMCAIFSFLALKLDLNEEYFKYLSLISVLISSVIISYFSVKPFKNNGAVLGIISIAPLLIYSLINYFICSNDLIFLVIKIVLSLAISALFGYYSIKKSKKIRIK